MEENLIDFFRENIFKENWFDSSKFLENKSAYYQDFELVLSKVGIEICDFYTFLLLSGEYSKLTIREFSESKKNLTDYLFFESTNIVIPEDEINLDDLQAFQSIFYHYTFNVLENFIFPNYENLLKDLKIQFTFDNKFKLNSKKQSSIPNFSEPEFTKHLKIFIATLKITRIEHFEFKYTNETVQKLHTLRNEIERTRKDSPSSLIDAILVKANFLFKKFLYRNKLEVNDNRYTQFISDLDTDKEYSIETFKIGYGFKFWEERILCHYELSDFWNQQNKTYEKQLPQNDERKLKFQDFHVLTKNYKDIYKSSIRIENLLSEFEKNKVENPSDNFDSYAYSISSTYIFNNLLSSKLEKDPYSIDKVRNLIRQVEDHQEYTHTYNFFPWEKLAKYISIEIDRLSNILFKSEKYEEYNQNIELFQKIIEKYDRCFNWSLKKNYLPFQFPYKECFSEYYFDYKVTKQSYPLFLFSSYVLPSNYEYYLTIFNQIKNKKLKLEALGEVYKSLQNIVDEVKINSDKVNNTERRSIEILGIFSAVALFSIGSIQIFSFIPIGLDPQVFYNFIASFGYSLALFVLLIWMITRQHIKEVTQFHWLVLATLVVSSFFLINSFTNSIRVEDMKNLLPKIEDKTNVNQSIDSIQFLNFKKDSIKSVEKGILKAK